MNHPPPPSVPSLVCMRARAPACISPLSTVCLLQLCSPPAAVIASHAGPHSDGLLLSDTVSPGLFGLCLNWDPPSRAAGLSEEFPHTAANLVSSHRFLLLTSSVALSLSRLRSLTADTVVRLWFEPCEVLSHPNLHVFAKDIRRSCSVFMAPLLFNFYHVCRPVFSYFPCSIPACPVRPVMMNAALGIWIQQRDH